MQVRPATPADIPAIQTIYAHHVMHGLASFEVDPPTPAEMRRRFGAITGDNYPYLVAVDGEAVLGYAYAGAYRDRPAYRWAVEDSVYVAAGAARRGIGRLLLGQLIEECQRRGYRQLLAVIGDSANVASIELHRGCGFTYRGTLAAVGYKLGRWVDSVIMQRALGDGDRSPADA